MQRHALLGCDIVARRRHARRGALGPPPPRALRRQRLPRRPAGDDIPLESRIILVADAYEAMTSDRPYRKAPGQAFAVAELRRNAGTQFDPARRRRALPRARPRRRRGRRTGFTGRHTLTDA